MRGCASVLVLAAAFALAATWFAGPPLAAGLIEAGLAGSGFEATTMAVTVRSDPPFKVLGGTADRVDIAADGATFGDLDARRIDLALLDVDLLGRTFGEVDGDLVGVRVRDGQHLVSIRSISLDGASPAANAIVTMAGEEVERAAKDRLDAALGVPVGQARLSAPDLLHVSVGGQGMDVRLVVEPGGSLALAAPLPGTPRVALIDADPLVLESVTVADGELILVGTLDVRMLLGVAADRPASAAAAGSTNWGSVSLQGTPRQRTTP